MVHTVLKLQRAICILQKSFSKVTMIIHCLLLSDFKSVFYSHLINTLGICIGSLSNGKHFTDCDEGNQKEETPLCNCPTTMTVQNIHLVTWHHSFSPGRDYIDRSETLKCLLRSIKKAMLVSLSTFLRKTFLQAFVKSQMQFIGNRRFETYRLGVSKISWRSECWDL